MMIFIENMEFYDGDNFMDFGIWYEDQENSSYFEVNNHNVDKSKNESLKDYFLEKISKQIII